MPQVQHPGSDLLHIWTAPNSKRKLTDTEVDCVHISGVRAEPSAQLEFRACRPQQLEGLGAVIKVRFPARRIDRSAIRQFVNASLVTLLHCFLIRLAGCEHRPDDTGHLVRDRNNGSVGASSGLQSKSPGVFLIMLGGGGSEYRTCTVYEQGT